SRWWSSAKDYAPTRVLHKTNDFFKAALRVENPKITLLLEILSLAFEWKLPEFPMPDGTIVKGLSPSTPEELSKLYTVVRDGFDDRTGERLEKPKKLPFNAPLEDTTWWKVLLLMYAHFARVKFSDSAMEQRWEVERRLVVEKSLHLLGAMLQITAANYPLTGNVIAIIELGQCVVQAMWIHQSPLLQLPYVDREVLKHTKTKKRDVRTITQLLEIRADDRQSILRSLTPEQYRCSMLVAQTFPVLEVLSAEAKVINEERVMPESFVTLFVRINYTTRKAEGENLSAIAQKPEISTLETSGSSGEVTQAHGDGEAATPEDAKSSSEDKAPAVSKTSGAQDRKNKKNKAAAAAAAAAAESAKNGDKAEEKKDGESSPGHASKLSEEEEEADRARKWWESNKNSSEPVHAPFYPAEKRPGWWIVFGFRGANNQIPLLTVSKVTDVVEGKPKVVKIQFRAPPKVGVYQFVMWIKSDSWVGADVFKDVKLVVQEPLPDLDDPDDDDISEPDEDTLAGAFTAAKKELAQMKREIVGGAKPEEDDEDDSSDED
ncbi:secretory subunit, partial [Gonapodya sp. JEL0774]